MPSIRKGQNASNDASGPVGVAAAIIVAETTANAVSPPRPIQPSVGVGIVQRTPIAISAANPTAVTQRGACPSPTRATYANRREHAADEELAGSRRQAVVDEVVVPGRGRDPRRQQRDADADEQHRAEAETEARARSVRTAAPPTPSAAAAGRTAPRPRGSSSAAAVTALRTARRTSSRRRGSASSRRTRARRRRRSAGRSGSTESDESSESTSTSPMPASAAGSSRRSRRAQNLGSSSAAFRTPSSSSRRVIRYPERVKNTESDSVAPGKSGDPAWKQKMTAIARPRTPSRPGWYPNRPKAASSGCRRHSTRGRSIAVVDTEASPPFGP